MSNSVVIMLNTKIERVKKEVSDKKRYLELAQSNVKRYTETLERLGLELADLTAARDILVTDRLIKSTLAPSMAELPAQEIIKRKAWTDVLGSRGVWHTIDAAVCGPIKTFVFICDCESFRFTKGELTSGKTCKHINRHLNAQGATFQKVQTRLRRFFTEPFARLHANYR